MKKELFGRAVVTASVAVMLSSLLNSVLYFLIYTLNGIGQIFVPNLDLQVLAGLPTTVFTMASIAAAMFLTDKFIWCSPVKVLPLIIVSVGVPILDNLFNLLNNLLNTLLTYLCDELEILSPWILSNFTTANSFILSVFSTAVLIAAIWVVYIINNREVNKKAMEAVCEDAPEAEPQEEPAQ